MPVIFLQAFAFLAVTMWNDEARADAIDGEALPRVGAISRARLNGWSDERLDRWIANCAVARFFSLVCAVGFAVLVVVGHATGLMDDSNGWNLGYALAVGLGPVVPVLALNWLVPRQVAYQRTRDAEDVF